MKPIIKVQNLSKQYSIGAAEAPYATFRETISGILRAPLKRLRGNGRVKDETIWALRDVSFEVEPGEVVGIIGRNGAGKSTLLKILSRITEPTIGAVDLYGRVASLLEVGTGFHPELTGRENTYLNGAILGMSRIEIERKFDEIVAFAEIAKFLDTPVKRYSSGMYVRLAFAVAAHLEPEILIVDEVLAVGDAAFQKKCLGKMEDVAKHGRTVLFVSHNMPAVKTLCSRALLLDAGSMVLDGGVDHIVDTYLRVGTDQIARTGIIPEDAPRTCGTGEVRFRSVQLTDRAGTDVSQLYLGQPFRVSLTFEALKEIREALIDVTVVALDGTRVAYASTIDGGNPPIRIPPRLHTIEMDMDVVLLPREYTFAVGIHHSTGTTIELIERALDFTVLRVAQNGGDSYRWPTVWGYVRPSSRWYARELFPNALTTGVRGAQDQIVGGNNGTS